MKAENGAYARWDHVSGLEEIFLKQRSKLHWLKVGDKNTKAFHSGIAARKNQNTIREVLQRRDGHVVDTTDEIQHEAEGFFKDFLQHVPQDYEGNSVENLSTLLPDKCTEEDSVLITSAVTGEEIRQMLFSMPNNKSPGPDGFNAEFFKKVWPIIGNDFTTAIQPFFEKGFLPKGINSTILALVPKKQSATEMKDYRPISCCNVIYKVIAKIIANRLKGTLPSVISMNQPAFGKDRLLIENLLLTTELVIDYHKDSISSRYAIKVDISKAFDSVQWTFFCLRCLPRT
ncbi:hypothetical protein V5N11_007543 [Cardamine amara subsp. amara]|uniref:Reverse transcriptase domain-containing protein n=1 Tax=Cardamine amara subsp. amara TaxID=228776 RepID=A0ABD1A1M8_CARAN